MSSAKIDKIVALSVNEYEATLTRDGRIFTRKFLVTKYKGKEVVSAEDFALDDDSLSNLRAIVAAVKAFHRAHQPEDEETYEIDPAELWRTRAEQKAALLRYAHEHSDAEITELIRQSFNGLPEEQQRSLRADLSAESQASLDALLAEDQNNQ